MKIAVFSAFSRLLDEEDLGRHCPARGQHRKASRAEFRISVVIGQSEESSTGATAGEIL